MRAARMHVHAQHNYFQRTLVSGVSQLHVPVMNIEEAGSKMQPVVRLAGSRVPIWRMMQSSLVLRSPTTLTSCAPPAAVPERIRSPPGLKHCFSTTACHSAKLYYTDKHVWVELASVATVGISAYAEGSLGRIEEVQLPDVEKKVQKGSECGTVQGNKGSIDIYSPVAGTVIEKNEMVEDKTKFINESPLGDGWLFKVEVSDASEVDGLMDEKAYKQYLESMEEEEEED